MKRSERRADRDWSTAVAVSTSFHRGLRLASRAFGGRYGHVPTQANLTPEQLVVHAAGVDLRVLQWDGEGPPVLLLHGLNNNAWSWAWVAAQLAPSRRVVAVSQRGHGGSSAPDRGYALRQTSEDLGALLDAMQIETCDLAGHSWGGKVATHFAAVTPQRVRSLILADPAPPRGLNRLISALPMLATASLRAERGPFPDRAAWEHAGHCVNYLQRWDDLDQTIWREGFERSEGGVFRHRLPESAFDELLNETLADDIEPLLPNIRAQVLLMRPTFTLSFVPGEWRRARRSLRGLREVRIAGDHTFIHTNPIDTADTIKRFLRIRAS